MFKPIRLDVETAPPGTLVPGSTVRALDLVFAQVEGSDEWAQVGAIGFDRRGKFVFAADRAERHVFRSRSMVAVMKWAVGVAYMQEAIAYSQEREQ